MPKHVWLLGFLAILGCEDFGSVLEVTPTEGSNEQVELTSVRDNTLFESESGSLSNGAGPNMFAGKTASGSLRRALVAFDLTSIPVGAQIDSVSLILHVERTPPSAPKTTFTMHRVEQDWGEGTSRPEIGNGGMGTAATPRDATWLHTFHDNDFWTNPGGDFDTTVTARQTVESRGSLTWGSTDRMVADVQSWIDDPGANWGWMLVGEENVSASARVLRTREHSVGGERPRLIVHFQLKEPLGVLAVSGLRRRAR